MEKKIEFKSIPMYPKTKDRWLVQFPDEYNIKAYYLAKITKPKYENGEWNNIRVVFRNTTPDSPEKGLVKLIATYGVSTSEKVRFTIEDFDPTGVVIGKWEIIIKEIVSIDFGGELSYDDDEPQDIELIVKPLFCTPLI